MAVSMKEIIKVSPTTPRPYPRMRNWIGQAGEDYFEEMTRERALVILEDGYTLDLIKADGSRMALTKDYLLNTETEAGEEEEEESETEEPVQVTQPEEETEVKEEETGAGTEATTPEVVTMAAAAPTTSKNSKKR